LEESGVYPFELNQPPKSNQTNRVANSKVIDIFPLIRSVYSESLAGVSQPVIAARFHNTLAQIVLVVCQAIRMETGVNTVVLSGGVWQNIVLLDKTFKLLQGDNYTTLTHLRIPPNDGGIALGQAAIALNYLNHH
jgi:hydrogenase maturation protein HypF